MMFAQIEMEPTVATELRQVRTQQVGTTQRVEPEVDDFSMPSYEPSKVHAFAAVSIPIYSQRSHWNKADEDRFENLAVKAATGRLTEKDRNALRLLEHDRNTLLHPRSEEEIRADYERSRITRDLITALQRYVAFFGPSKKATKSK